MKEGRYLGLDVGEKTIGVAVSDPLGWTAQGLLTIKRKGRDEDFSRLREIIVQQNVKAIVVGLPRNMNGSDSEQTEKVRRFIQELREEFALPVYPWDERLTTVAAEKLLLEADMSRRRRKQVVDKMAAVLILQGFLDSRRGSQGFGNEEN
ncbi:MAG: putative pre6S rRNA nuclease [Eubacteriales bacterium]|nr:putative pre6S rRNA nuclease [Eubacteriales bacterium]